ncbi:MAG: hypothetical protein KBA66_15600 [Leptospiraceae bacterium]|nr:hypothetical protein [Leptospiraceae bacterium]
MSQIKNIEKIPEEVRELTEIGLGAALKKGSLGKMKINFIQIENSLSGGKTGAVVLVARYGLVSLTNRVEENTTFVRVLKIAPKEVCESENEGYVKTRETLLDIFSQVEYYTEDEFVYDHTTEKGGLYRKDLINQVLTIESPTSQKDKSKTYGILLYQDVGTVAASDLKGIAKYFTNKILKADNEHKSEIKEDTEKFSRELSLLMQKEVFLGLKKGLYGTVKRRDVNLSDIYGSKISSGKVKQGLAELKAIDETLPDHTTILEYFNINVTYHEVNYVHGDLNPENVLVWENERGFLNCKLIDFGEVMPKKRDNFTPLFWDYSRLLGEMILNFVEELLVVAAPFGSAQGADSVDKALNDKVRSVSGAEPSPTSIDSILNDFWSVVEAFFKNDPSKLENANPKIEYISRIYLSTLFDFINEAKSGLKDLRRAEVMQDYFYCQILFFLFFAKFQKENPYKRLFGVKFALKLYEYANSGEAGFQSLILSLEKFYFAFSSSQAKNKQPQIGPAVGARSPFMGLSYFQEKDREFFFGREKFTDELLKAIEEKPIVALAGASGSGKSSVVHAGVIPKLREQGYLIYKFRPGVNPYMAAVRAFHSTGLNFVGDGRDRPLRNLTELIGNILKSNPNKRIFLLGDQFEELFTLCTDATQREDLGAALIEAAKEFKDRFRFFITIRSDFWTKLLEDAGFASVIGNSGDYKDLGERFFLSAMNLDELRSTIEKPLAVAKLFIQDGLTDLILTSISKEPGSLPLLEFCLHELWKKQVDYTLNYNAYKEIGEVKGALATYADQVYDSLSVEEQEQLKKIMLQLVQPGQGTEDTRRIALVEEVVVDARFGSAHRADSSVKGDGADSTEKALNEKARSVSGAEPSDVREGRVFIHHLADLRLITTGTNEEGKQTIEVVHEALIREWKTLREWINADREFRVWQEKVRYAEKEWSSEGKEEEQLLAGSALVTAEDWYSKRKADLGLKEIEYIEKSVEERNRIQREKEEAKERERQRELDAQKKKKRFTQVIAITSAAAAVMAIVLSWWALGQKAEAVANGLKAEALVLNNNYENNKDYAISYFEMLTVAFKASEVSDKFSIQKLNVLSTLYNFIYQPKSAEFYFEYKDSVKNFSFGERVGLLRHSSYVRSVSFSPDGKYLASGSDDNTIKIWDLENAKEMKSLTGHSSYVTSVSFSPDGKYLASGSYDKTIKIWDLENAKERKSLTGHSSYVNSVSFSPDGKYLASGSNDSTIKIWDLEIESILPLACEKMQNNMEHWVLLKDKSPVPVKEVEQNLKKCKEILAKKPKLEKSGEEYKYLAEARNNLIESSKAEKEEDKKQKLENAISNLKEAVKVNPNFALAKSELENIYFKSENPDLALEYFPEKEYFYLKRARKSDDAEKKIADYQEALKINSKLIVAKSELARIYFDAGKEKEAFELEKQKEYLYLYRARKTDDKEKKIADYLEALKINSKLQPVKVELAKIYIEKGYEFSEKKEYANAVTEFTKAINLRPDHAIYYDFRGDAYYANKEIDKAIDDYETFLDLEKSDHKRMNEETKKFLTTEEGKTVSKEELKLALDFSQKSLELSPDNPDYLNTLAEIYLKLGDKSNAKKANDKAKKIAEEEKDAELLKGILERYGRL